MCRIGVACRLLAVDDSGETMLDHRSIALPIVLLVLATASGFQVMGQKMECCTVRVNGRQLSNFEREIYCKRLYI